MKKQSLVCFILMAALMVFVLSACGESAQPTQSISNSPSVSETPVISEPPVVSEPPEEPSAPTENTVDFNGTYNCVLNGPMGEQNVVLIVSTDEDGNVTGSYNGNELTEGVLTGNQFELKTMMLNPALGEMEVVISGTVDGDDFTAEVITVVSTSTLVGSRG